MPFGIEKHYFVGLVFILLCACLWAGSSVLIQYIYSDLSFNSPFLLTYLATSLLVLHLPYHHGKELVLFHWKQAHPVDPTDALRDKSFAHQDYSLHNDDDPLIRPIAAIEIQNQQPSSPERIPSTADSVVSVTEQQAAAKAAATIDSSPFAADYEALKLSLIIAPMWFLANCLYNYSLLMTTVSSSTVISNLSAAFTLLFSSFLRLEQASYVKIVGVVICFVGAITTGLADSGSGGGGGGNDDGPNHTVGGDIVAVLSAAGYGLYTTTIRYLVPEDESEADDDNDTTTTTTRRSGDDVEGAARTASSAAAVTVSALHNPHHNSNDSNANNNSSSGRDSHPPATQTTQTKRRPVSMHLLLGYIGLVNALLLAPVVGIMVRSPSLSCLFCPLTCVSLCLSVSLCVSRCVSV